MEQVNRTKIEWVRNPDGSQGYTWNPVVGCRRGCSYCYARRFAERGLGEYGLYVKGHRFLPRFFPERLLQPTERLKPARIFVCSMGELFGPWVPAEWQERVLSAARQTPWHTFMFLTKYPENLAQFNPWPPNAWVGATATDDDMAWRALEALADVNASVRYLSVEPLLGRIADQTIPFWLDWLIIGAQTGPGAQSPNAEWVEELIERAYFTYTALFLKGNLDWPERIQEWPKGER